MSKTKTTTLTMRTSLIVYETDIFNCSRQPVWRVANGLSTDVPPKLWLDGCVRALLVADV